MPVLLPVAVPLPAHSDADSLLTYRSEAALAPGTLVRVPLGKREIAGIVWGAPAADDGDPDVRGIVAVLNEIGPLDAGWRALVSFAAAYYQRSIGELASSVLPAQLRTGAPPRRRRKRAAERDAATSIPPVLSAQQAAALTRLAAGAETFLLFGATGSGKTEVYLQAVAQMLERSATAQALVLVPEINLTPQLEARFHARFGAGTVVAMHSGMTHPQRLASWLAAHHGHARIVLGTRLAVFASMPELALVVVDEEHDPSYKQQEGARYSARDLAVWRGHRQGVRVILGSATPSLESWHAAATGRYQRLDMPERAATAGSKPAPLPAVRMIDMNLQPRATVLAADLVAAIAARAARGEQSLLLLNRRGYAPVLACRACDWKSECPHCSAYRVFHKIDRTLRCHHCGFAERVPRACPVCGDLDLAPVGRGTEQLEEQVERLLGGTRRADGAPLRIARLDADTTRRQGALESQLAQVHAGEVDVLVGTQMIAKGHDFRRVTLVAALNPDGALFSSDFRAPERLFSLLLQAAGRAGRDAAQASQAQMWVQTFHPAHPLFAALRAHDYSGFAQRELAERERAGMPPFQSQALLRAEARTQEAAQRFLQGAAEAAAGTAEAGHVTLYPPVPMGIQRVAGVERAQMLLESAYRPALQRFLASWHPALHAIRVRGLIRWAIDVDPLRV